MEENDKAYIDNAIKKAAAFSTKKIGDTPTDANQLVPKKYVDSVTGITVGGISGIKDIEVEGNLTVESAGGGSVLLATQYSPSTGRGALAFSANSSMLTLALSTIAENDSGLPGIRLDGNISLTDGGGSTGADRMIRVSDSTATVSPSPLIIHGALSQASVKGGQVLITGGHSNGTGGGEVAIQGGSVAGGTIGQGGNVLINAGPGSIAGTVILGEQNINSRTNVTLGSTNAGNSTKFGFPFIPDSATGGGPSGTPVQLYTGYAAMAYDSVAHKLYIYDTNSGSWRSATFT